MNEHGFTKSVLGEVPPYVHRQSMTGAALANNGTPDRYLDFDRDFWVEFKFLKSMPRAYVVPSTLMTALQRQWLERRWRSGRNAALCIGFIAPSIDRATKAGVAMSIPPGRTCGVLIDHPALWNDRWDAGRFFANAESVKALGALLTQKVSK